MLELELVLLPFLLMSEWRSALPPHLCRSMLSWWVTLPSPMTTSLQRLSPTRRASTASPWSGWPPACPSTQTRWVTDEKDLKRTEGERDRGREEREGADSSPGAASEPPRWSIPSLSIKRTVIKWLFGGKMKAWPSYLQPKSCFCYAQAVKMKNQSQKQDARP